MGKILVSLLTALISSLAWGAPFLVVLDPGHGGADFGTVYTRPDPTRFHVAEKNVTLALALQTARQLRAHGIKVILTRESDQDVPLSTRTAIANKVKADLFISIHMNAGAAEGVETYILNNTTDATSRRLAQIENTNAQQSDVDLIIKDLRLDANLPESKRLACAVQENLVSAMKKKNRGVKQALFYVLLGADMPSALLEAGFLSDARDRAFVLSEVGQRSISMAIARAVEQFRKLSGTPAAAAVLSRCQVH